MLQIGMTAETSRIVAQEDTAMAIGSGTAPVLATPKLIALLENAAMNAVGKALEEGTATVGTKISAEHIVATPLGMKVTAKATLISIENRKLTFELEAHDEVEKVAFGVHERFIVYEEKFIAKANAKK